MNTPVVQTSSAPTTHPDPFFFQAPSQQLSGELKFGIIVIYTLFGG